MWTVIEVKRELTGFEITDPRKRLQESGNFVERSGLKRFRGYSVRSHHLHYTEVVLFSVLLAG